MLLSEMPSVHLPLLDHWHVFDLAAMLAAQSGGTVKIAARSPLYTRELRRRVENQTGHAHTLIWAEPDADSLPSLTSALEDYSRVIAIGGGRLSGLLLREPPMHWKSVSDRLASAGFEVEARYGFHGPSSLFWAVAVRLMQALQRDDLADRCLYRMRSVYATPQTVLTALNVIVMRRVHG